jgi:transcription elongation factor/antiterminator RfaH
MPAWYALYTRPRHEKRVLEELTRRKVESFLPTYKVRRRWSDRYKIIEEPLFKNYLFVYIDHDTRLHDILRHHGAVSFVSFNGIPAVIPEAEIASIRRLVESELPYNPHPFLKVGRKVRVKSGPLVGCEGILTRKRGLARLVLSINLLQQSVVAEVDADTVEPI